MDLIQLLAMIGGGFAVGTVFGYFWCLAEVDTVPASWNERDHDELG